MEWIAMACGRYLAVLDQVATQGLDVVIEPEILHGSQDIIAVDGLTVLLGTLFACSTASRYHTRTWIEQEHHQHHDNRYELIVRSISASLYSRGIYCSILARDEAHELGHTLLHGLLGFVGDLCVGREGPLHDARDIGDGQISILLAKAHVRLASIAVLALTGHMCVCV